MLYIQLNHKDNIHSLWGKISHTTWGKSKDITPTTWGTDWDYFSAADHVVITLYPSLCWRYETSIITILYI